jgi:oxygen-dependent protoporphyrinogen oxidase
MVDDGAWRILQPEPTICRHSSAISHVDMPPSEPSLVDRPRIAIIGGGISGLAAAHRLTELLPHAELAVFEAADRLGGVIRTIQRDGCLVEQAADSFITKTPWAVDLCTRLGIAEEVLSTNVSKRRAYVVRRGQLLPVPDGFVLMTPRKLWPLLTTRVLSWRGKLRLVTEPLMPERRLIPGGNSKTVEPDDESVAAFATRRLGREAFERLVQPLLVGIYTADPAKLSMAATLPEVWQQHRQFGSLLRAGRNQSTDTGLQTGQGEATAIAESGARYGLFVAPKNGMSSIIDALARPLPRGAVRLSSHVSGIGRGEVGDWHLRLPDHTDPQRFDAVVVAVPTPAAGRILRDYNAELAADLTQIAYAGCAVISSSYRRDQFSNFPVGFGFVVPLVEKRQILAASFASEKFLHRAPDDQVIVRAFVGGALQPQLMELSDNELSALAHCELRDLLKIAGQPLWTDVAKWPGSMPQYYVGHLERVTRIEARVADQPGLALAGNAYHGVGIPQCIHSGELAAERIAARWTHR